MFSPGLAMCVETFTISLIYFYQENRVLKTKKTLSCTRNHNIWRLCSLILKKKSVGWCEIFEKHSYTSNPSPRLSCLFRLWAHQSIEHLLFWIYVAPGIAEPSFWYLSFTIMKTMNNCSGSGSFVCEGGGCGERFWAIYLLGRSTVGDISDQVIYNYKLTLYSFSTPNFTPPRQVKKRVIFIIVEQKH